MRWLRDEKEAEMSKNHKWTVRSIQTHDLLLLCGWKPCSCLIFFYFLLFNSGWPEQNPNQRKGHREEAYVYSRGIKWTGMDKFLRDSDRIEMLTRFDMMSFDGLPIAKTLRPGKQGGGRLLCDHWASWWILSERMLFIFNQTEVDGFIKWSDIRNNTGSWYFRTH